MNLQMFVFVLGAMIEVQGYDGDYRSVPWGALENGCKVQNFKVTRTGLLRSLGGNGDHAEDSARVLTELEEDSEMKLARVREFRQCLDKLTRV